MSYNISRRIAIIEEINADARNLSVILDVEYIEPSKMRDLALDLLTKSSKDSNYCSRFNGTDAELYLKSIDTSVDSPEAYHYLRALHSKHLSYFLFI